MTTYEFGLNKSLELVKESNEEAYLEYNILRFELLDLNRDVAIKENIKYLKKYARIKTGLMARDISHFKLYAFKNKFMRDADFKKEYDLNLQPIKYNMDLEMRLLKLYKQTLKEFKSNSNIKFEDIYLLMFVICQLQIERYQSYDNDYATLEAMRLGFDVINNKKKFDPTIYTEECFAHFNKVLTFNK